MRKEETALGGNEAIGDDPDNFFIEKVDSLLFYFSFSLPKSKILIA